MARFVKARQCPANGDRRGRRRPIACESWRRGDLRLSRRGEHAATSIADAVQGPDCERFSPGTSKGDRSPPKAMPARRQGRRVHGHSGPGATNLVTAIGDAKMDSIPLIALTGQVGTSVIGSDAFQETPIVEVCRGITKHHYLVPTRRRRPRDERSVPHRDHGRPGPVFVDLPKKSTGPGYARLRRANESAGLSVDVRAPAGANRPSGGGDQAARRPVIYAGGGIISSGAQRRVAPLIHNTDIPITTTVMGLGAIRADDPLWLDMLGMHGSVYSTGGRRADLMLALGVRFDDRVTGKKEEFASMRSSSTSTSTRRRSTRTKWPISPIVSDLKFALRELNKVVEPPTADLEPWHQQIAEWKGTDPFHYDETFDGILPQHAIAELSRLTGGENTIVSVGVGQHQMWSAQFYKFIHPRTWLWSSGLGTMGFGLPAAMGPRLPIPTSWWSISMATAAS